MDADAPKTKPDARPDSLIRVDPRSSAVKGHVSPDGHNPSATFWYYGLRVEGVVMPAGAKSPSAAFTDRHGPYNVAHGRPRPDRTGPALLRPLPGGLAPRQGRFLRGQDRGPLRPHAAALHRGRPPPRPPG